MTAAPPARVAALPPDPRLPVGVQTLLFGARRDALLPYLRRRYGDVFSVRLAPHARKIVFISRPEHIKTVFAGPPATFHAGEGNAVLEPIMGPHSVLLLDESEHLRIRQLLMPAFHGQALRGYRDLVGDLARAEFDGWRPGRAFRAHDRMTALTLEIILQVVFGVTDERRLAELRPVVNTVVNVSPVIMMGWFYPQLRRYPPWRGFQTCAQRLDRELYAEIAARRAYPDLAERGDVLSRLLSSSSGELTDVELRDNLVTLLLAGHETTATALAWALHELARDPAVLRRAQQAADDGDEEYLEAVAKESLRLHPVIYEVARRLTSDTEVGGHLLPRGATVMPGIGLVQSDPEHFPDPAAFRPERFLGRQPAPNTWIPFGGGVRRCLGAGFSLMEATVVLRELLTRYDVTADRAAPERARSRNVTLAPARGARIVVTAR